jgi:hypothetical protein
MNDIEKTDSYLGIGFVNIDLLKGFIKCANGVDINKEQVVDIELCNGLFSNVKLVKIMSDKSLTFKNGPPNLTKDAVFDDLDLDKISDKEFNFWFRRFYKGDCCVPFKVWNEACRRANKVGVYSHPEEHCYVVEVRMLIWAGALAIGFICGWLAHG